MNEPKLHFEFTDHFPIRLIQRGFDLAVLIPLYKAVSQAKKGETIRVTAGNTTVVAKRVSGNIVRLITGWKG